MNKGFAVILILLITTSSLGLLMVKPANAQSKTIIVPDDYSTIQAAIGNASAGDTIFVRSGTYNGSISINKSINLIGESGQTTILTMPEIYSYAIDVSPPNTYVVNINANNVGFSNFTIDNPNISGIGINSNGNGNQIQGVFITNNSGGIVVSGANQYIAQNKIAQCQQAIQISGSNCQIFDNTLLADTTGIFLSGSENSVAQNFVTSSAGINVILQNANTNIIFNNTIKGDIALQKSNSNIVYNNTITEGYLWLGDPLNSPASFNLIAKNVIENASKYGWGILVGYGSNNILYGNLVVNGGYGLAVGGIDIEVSNNLVYYNMFVNNTKNFGTNWQVIGSNSFDNGTVGNYWDDYTIKYPNATEVGNSGIGNTPYLVYCNVTDNYPLMAPFNISNINIQLPTWINSLPSPQLIQTFPLQTPTTNQTNPSTTPAIPEISWLVIAPLLLSVFLIAVIVRHQKTASLGKKAQ